MLRDDFTLNPLNASDAWGDPDEDGYLNWEEYNSIDPRITETNRNRSSPQFYVVRQPVTNQFVPQQWTAISHDASFGRFVTAEQYARSGPTADPNDPDSDGDGMLDGVESLFAVWNATLSIWTLNPLMAGDGGLDSDADGLADRLELTLADAQPENGGSPPVDAPLLHVDAALQTNPIDQQIRVFQIIDTKSNRGQRFVSDYVDWANGLPPTPFLEVLLAVSDPGNEDTDLDNMSDGFEYWFTEWDLNGNRWTLNPLANDDAQLDADGDSYDCDRDGEIEANERYTNVREFEARYWGRQDRSFTFPSGTTFVGFGEDGLNAIVDGGSTPFSARAQMVDAFIRASPIGAERIARSTPSTHERSTPPCSASAIRPQRTPTETACLMGGSTATLLGRGSISGTTGRRTRSIHWMVPMIQTGMVGTSVTPWTFLPHRDSGGIASSSHRV